MGWFVWAIFSVFIDSFIFTFCKSSLKDVDPVIAIAVRSAAMTSIILLVALGLNKFDGLYSNTTAMQALTPFYIAGALSGISYIFYFIALKYGFASKIYAIDQLSYVFIMFLSIVFLKEVVTLRMVIGGALIMAGAYLSI